MIIDIGCGNNKWPDAFGIDLVPPPITQADALCNLGFEKLPVSDDVAEKVVARHIVEHIPDCIFIAHNGDSSFPLFKRLQPTVFLFNEVWRVLQDKGIFYIEVPLVPSQAAWQDPTHISSWNLEKFNYFSGDYYGFHDHYNHTSRFAKKSLKVEGGWLGKIELVAIKSLPDDHPYLLEYPVEVTGRL